MRWLACAASHDLAVRNSVQLLHGVVVAGLLLGGPLYLESIVLRAPARHRPEPALDRRRRPRRHPLQCRRRLIDRIGIDATYALGGVGGILLGLSVTAILPQPTPPMDTRAHE
ncbi:MAG: hypothetical protein U0802_15675 [Candidatus Binatia bacterium]